MLNIPISILIALIVFIIFLTALFFIFGTPQCDSLANQTAYSIKLAVDNVALNSFPMWDGNGVPSDGDYAYYQTATIRLCQEQGTSFWDSFFGRPPEYQIYHEVFPEGGFTWNEAYPWSGGAAGTLKFWAAMRIGVGVWKLGSAYYSKVGWLEKTVSMIKGKLSILRPRLFNTDFKEAFEILQKKYADLGITMPPIKRPADIITTLQKNFEADEIYDVLKQAGWLTEEVDELGNVRKLVISSQEIPVTAPVRNADGVVEEKVLYVKKSEGKIVDIATEPADDFEVFKVKPSDVYNDYLSTVSKQEKEELEKMFTVKPQGFLKKVSDLPNVIRDTEWFKKNFQPTLDKIKVYAKRLDVAGFDTDFMNANGRGVVLATQDLIKDDYWYQKIIKDETLMEKIKTTFRLASKTDVTKEHVAKYMSNLLDNFNGFVFIPKELKWRIDEVAMNIVENTVDGNLPLDKAKLVDDIVNFAKTETDLIDRFGEGSEVTFRNTVNNIVDNEIWDAANNFKSSTSRSMTDFTRDVFYKHMENSRSLIDAGSEEGWREISLMLGTVEQNKNVLPFSYTAIGVEGLKANFKKVVYLDVSAILNPGSWYAMGFFATSALEGCEGNSICLLSKNSLESPLYLNKEADNYDVRLWRPVEIWQQWAGLQAAIMHVPSNPRFYVVSPCFALAKVWKTTYDGAATIFILPEKVETNGSSNYCYADSDLINKYTAIWAVSDILDFMPWGRFLESLKLSKEFGTAIKYGTKTISTTADLVDEIVGIADPATLLQGVLEGAVSWPGGPWEPLGPDEMAAAQQNFPTKELTRDQE